MATAYDRETDVVVIGSGAAGGATAVACATAGLDVEMLEKASLVGGGTAYSYGGVWVGNNSLEREAGIADSHEDVVAYFRFLNAGYFDPAHLDVLTRKAPEAIDHFRRLGVPFQIVQGAPDHYYPQAPGSLPTGRTLEVGLFPAESLGPLQPLFRISPYVPRGATWTELLAWGGFASRAGWPLDLMRKRVEQGDHRGFGMALAGHLLKVCIDAGVHIRPSSPVHRLLGEGGRVDGVEATVDGQLVRMRARQGVVIATGGYEGNQRLVQRFEAIPEWESMFPASVAGDGLIMAAEQGAALGRAPESLRLMLGYRVPPEEGSEVTFRSAGIAELTAPHTVVVNARGRRFADESSFQYVVTQLKKFDVASHTYPNMPCFLIMDSTFFDKYGFAGAEAGSAPPPWLPRADSVPELARVLGIDPDQLGGTIREFNEHARAGRDPVFGRGEQAFGSMIGGDTSGSNANMAALETPPFFGVHLIPTGVSSTGLVTEPDGAVTSVRDEPIQGLYAAGNAAVTMEWGPGYQAGLSLARAVTMGYVIGGTLTGVDVLAESASGG